jgi:hypothetical protein
MDVDRNSIGLVKHNEIQQLPTKKDHHTSRPLVVTLAIEVRRFKTCQSRKESGTKLSYQLKDQMATREGGSE